MKRSPLGRDPLEWIKVTKDKDAEGTAADRLTRSLDQEEKPVAPPEQKVEGAPAPAAPAPAAPVEEALPPKPEPPPAQEPAPPPEEPPVTITSTTATLPPETVEERIKESAEKAEESKPFDIPLFAKMEEEEKKQETAPPPETVKPAGRTLELKEVPAPQVEAPSVLEQKAKTPPGRIEVSPGAGHSINFTAPGIRESETVAVPAPKEAGDEKAADRPVAGAPPVLETPKEEETLAPPLAPQTEKADRLHVGPVDLRVERRPIPPVTKTERIEQPLSMTSVVLYICILLLAVLVLAAFFGNRTQVSKVRQELQTIKQQIKQITGAPGAPSQQ